jgi:Zn-dependent protease with chaperone function
MIFLRPSLKKAHPDLTRFIAAHEVAHLARDDVTSEGLAVACLATLVGVAAATGQPTCGGFTYLHSA